MRCYAGIIAILVLFATEGARADVTISSGATKNMTCSGGVCAPAAADATLNIADLENLLASGSIQVTTTGSGVQADNIVVDAALSWSELNTLALDAYQSVTVEKPVSITGLSALSITTNDGGKDGYFVFGTKGHVTFANLSSALTINGASYTLEGDIKSLAAAIAANPSGDFALADSYDASKDGIYALSPVGTFYGGLFEGLGNTISNLSIDHEKGIADGIGLFAEIAGAGAVESLRLQNFNYRDAVHIRGAGVVGGLVAGNLGLLFDDHVQGTIAFREIAGGLAANNDGTIEDCSTDINISQIRPGGAAGGLVGGNVRGTISKSYAIGEVEAGLAGGLAAENDGGSISDSYAIVQLNAMHPTTWIGGFSGYNENDGAIATSYSTGAVPKKHGGFDGAFEQDFCTDCYWDTQTSGTNDGVDGGNISGITGLTTKQLQSGLPAGFDPSVWAEDPKINNGLPYLIDNPPRKE